MALEVRKFEDWATKDNCAYLMSECVYERFRAEQTNKDLSPAVEEGDQVVAFDIRPEF